MAVSKELFTDDDSDFFAADLIDEAGELLRLKSKSRSLSEAAREIVEIAVLTVKDRWRRGEA